MPSSVLRYQACTLVHEHIFRQSNYEHKKNRKKKMTWNEAGVMAQWISYLRWSWMQLQALSIRPVWARWSPMQSVRGGAILVKGLGSSLAPVSETAGLLLWVAIMFRTPDSPWHRFFSGQHQQLFLEAEPSSFLSVPFLAELKWRQFDQSSFYALLSGHTKDWHVRYV